MCACVLHDAGIGIANELVERIFMPFVQADMSISRKFGGTQLHTALTHHCHHADHARVLSCFTLVVVVLVWMLGTLTC